VSGVRGLLDVRRILLPRPLAMEAFQHLRTIGAEGAEGLALWAGKREGSDFRVERTIVPAQHAIQFEDGVCVAVAGDELFRVNMILHEQQLTLIAQIHSHPGRAYHSETDDAYPVATTVGSLSVVVPQFARGPLRPATWAAYRLLPERGWVALDQNTFLDLLTISE